MRLHVLFVRRMGQEEDDVLQEMQKSGHRVSVCEIQGKSQEEVQISYIHLFECLSTGVYHIVVSVNFDEIAACVGSKAGVKYVSFQYDTSERALASAYVNLATNYIVVNEWLPYCRFRKSGIRTVYYSDFSIDGMLQYVFSEYETELYETYEKLLDFRQQPGNELEDTHADRLDAYAREKDLWLCLKKQCMDYCDSLLRKGSLEAWFKIGVWLRHRIACAMTNMFWEFHILNKMVPVCLKESDGERNCEMLMAQVTSVQELLRLYFKMTFLFRRVEYDIAVESHVEIISLIRKYSLSDEFLRMMLDGVDVYNRAKIIARLKVLWSENE